eukprot:g4309.t1
MVFLGKSQTTGRANEASSGSKSTEDKSDAKATSNGCSAGCELCHENHCFYCKSTHQRVNYRCERKACNDPKCLDCTRNVCYKCEEGFSPDRDGRCAWIGPSGCDAKNCKRCSTTRITCSECEPGYQLRSNTCYKNACTDSNCLRCSSDGKECEVCKDGFQSRLGECLEVGCLDDNCKQCSPSGGSCYKCNTGFYAQLKTGACRKCPDPNCSDCNGSQNSCTRCVQGYYVAQSTTGNRCAQCSEAEPNCEKCSRNGGDCHACAVGYYLEHGHCIGKLASYKTRSLNSMLVLFHLACPKDCAECKSPWFCDKCKAGFDLYNSGLCREGDSAALQSENGGTIPSPPIFTLFLLFISNFILFVFLY